MPRSQHATLLLVHLARATERGIVGEATSLARNSPEGVIAVSTSTINAFGYSEMFVAAPFELDYYEPNAVVEADQDLEFITTIETVKAVELPVTTVIEEQPVVAAVEAPAHSEPSVVIPVQRRTAA